MFLENQRNPYHTWRFWMNRISPKSHWTPERRSWSNFMLPVRMECIKISFNQSAQIIGCGHCKQLAPIYEQLGKAFSGESSCVVAKVDATQSGKLAETYGTFQTFNMCIVILKIIKVLLDILRSNCFLPAATRKRLIMPRIESWRHSWSF